MSTWLTTRQVADLVGVSMSTVTQWRWRGVGPSWRQNEKGRYFYLETELLDWLATPRPPAPVRNLDVSPDDAVRLYSTGGYTLQDIAVMAGVNPATVGRWVHGQVEPKQKPPASEEVVESFRERIEALGEDVEGALDALRDARRARAEACDEAQEAGVSYATLGGWLDITAAAVRRAVLEARS